MLLLFLSLSFSLSPHHAIQVVWLQQLLLAESLPVSRSVDQKVLIEVSQAHRESWVQEEARNSLSLMLLMMRDDTFYSPSFPHIFLHSQILVLLKIQKRVRKVFQAFRKELFSLLSETLIIDIIMHGE